MNRRTLFLVSIVIALLLVCFVSCEGNNKIPVGTLNLTVSDSMTRAIEPNIPLDVAKYEVSLLNGEGTAIVSKELDKSNPSVSQNNIPVGSYTVYVEAKNREGIIIGTGSAACIITKDAVTNVSVTVSELSGKGKLSVTLTGSVNTSGSYTLKVYKSDDTEVGSVAFTTVDSSLKAEIDLDNGFYYFVVTNTEGNASAPEAFRIVNGDNLTAEAYFYESTGSFRVTIINNIVTNPTLNLIISDSIIHEGEEFTITATGMSGESLSYSWYVNGKTVEGSGNSVNLNMDVAGTYSVRCLAKDSSSSVVWSCDKTITVHDAGYKPMELTLSGDIETWVIGDVLIPRDLVVTLKGNDSTLMTCQYGHGHNSFSLGNNTNLSCTLSGVEGYSYYFETEVAEDGSTIVYIVIDKEIENPAYLRIAFDYDYVFNKDSGEFRGFFLSPEGEDVDSERSGIVSLTNNTATRTIKVEPGSYRKTSGTGSNCPVSPEITSKNIVCTAGETNDITVTIPYCRVKLKNFKTDASSSMLFSEQNAFDYIYYDMIGDEVSFVLGNNYDGPDTFVLREENSDCVYRFEATITMGETIEVEPVRVDKVFVESDVKIPAGRALVKATSSVLFENAMWPIYKIEDASGNNLGTEDLDCILPQWFNSSSDMTISFADLLDTGYTFTVTVTTAEDENGTYSEVVVNVDKEIENSATLRITPDVDENYIDGKGTLISLQMEGDSQLILLPYWASMEPYELKVVPGRYRCCGFWNSYRDPNTDISYAPRVDNNFTCTSGETTNVTLYLEVWK